MELEQENIEGRQAAGAVDDGTHPESGIAGWKLTRFRKILLLSTTLCLLPALAGFLFIRFKPHLIPFLDGSLRLEPVTGIMRPVPQPDYREMLDFLLVYEVEGQKMITAMRMEVGFQSPMRYQTFKEQSVVFRDVVYAFLLKQNLYENSVRSWHSVVEKDLPDCLRVRLPQSFPDRILLTQVENL